MSSSGRRRFPVRLRRPKVVDVGCSCRGKKLFSFFTFSLLKHKSKPSCPLSKHQYHNPLSSSYYAPSSSSTTTTAATSPWATTSYHPSSLSTATTSFYGEDAPSPYSHSAWSRNDVKRLGTPKKKKQPLTRGTTGGKGAWAGDSVAVVKDSDDPYLDFRESMLQMILEKEIYAWEDLLELLNSFLALNAPCHHDLILRAFAEIWNGVFSSSSPPASGYSSSHVAGAAMHGSHGRPRRRRHHAGGGSQQPHPLT